MAHLVPSFLFVDKAQEVFISNVSLIKLKINKMTLTVTRKGYT